MGQQIGFYAIEEDYTSLLQLAQDIGLGAIPQLIPTGADVQASSLLKFAIPEGQDFFYLLPERFAAAEAFYDELPSFPSLSKLIPDTSPVIEFKPCLHEGNKVHNGRFYLDTNSGDPRYPIVRKKYNQLVRYVQRWKRTDQFRFYIGPYTAKLAQDGHIRLMHHLIELKVV